MRGRRDRRRGHDLLPRRRTRAGRGAGPVAPGPGRAGSPPCRGSRSDRPAGPAGAVRLRPPAHDVPAVPARRRRRAAAGFVVRATPRAGHGGLAHVPRPPAHGRRCRQLHGPLPPVHRGDRLGCPGVRGLRPAALPAQPVLGDRGGDRSAGVDRLRRGAGDLLRLSPARARRVRRGGGLVVGVPGRRLSARLNRLPRFQPVPPWALPAQSLAALRLQRRAVPPGTGAALIYWPDRTRDVAQITFVLNLLTGVAWFLLTWVVAPAVAAFFHSSGGTPILRVLGATFILRALGNTHDALCKKDLRFKARLIPEIGLAAVKAALTIALALAGLGVWSLVWGHLAAMGARAALLWRVVSWRPAWRWSANLLRPVLRYGGWSVVVNVVAVVVQHVDYIVVGRMLGVTALGF